MALIPYEHVPPPHDSPIVVFDQPIREFYCGDARCDCATAHVLVAGIPMTVDLGTTNVELVENRQQQQTPTAAAAQQALMQALRKELADGKIGTLRAHYQTVREYGREQHFRYVDWSAVKAGELVAWEQVFRTESMPFWTMTQTDKAVEKAEAEGQEPPSFLLGLGDAYCIEPRCDCQRVVWSVVTAPTGQANRAQSIGTVELPFATLQPSVLRHAPQVEPNQLFVLVHNLLRAQPGLIETYKQRYALLRQHLSPILKGQRRQKSEAHRQPTVNRNDPCPCGSGKKYKKCHGS
jgi:hypothetical protein